MIVWRTGDNKYEYVIGYIVCFQYKKELVILTLVKTEETTWAVVLSQNGLDQAPDES